MNDAIVQSATPVRAYVADVRAALHDLSSEEVDDLIGGLEADLAERASELPDGVDPAAAFGAPEVYAAELRAAAGLPPRPAGWAGAPRVSALHMEEAKWRATRDRWLAQRPWLGDLRPVWWLVRGAILVVLPLMVAGVEPFNGVLWAAALVGAGLSFAWSRGRDRQPSTAGNRLTILVNLAALLLAFPAFATWESRANASKSPQVVYQELATPGPTSGAWINGEAATNLYAYDAQGNRLDRVRLFNQYGQAVSIAPEGIQALSNRVEDSPIDPATSQLRPGLSPSVFPFRWGSRTGWETSSGQWEPPVKISELTPTASDDQVSPSASPSPSVSGSATP